MTILTLEFQEGQAAPHSRCPYFATSPCATAWMAGAMTEKGAFGLDGFKPTRVKAGRGFKLNLFGHIDGDKVEAVVEVEWDGGFAVGRLLTKRRQVEDAGWTLV